MLDAQFCTFISAETGLFIGKRSLRLGQRVYLLYGRTFCFKNTSERNRILFSRPCVQPLCVPTGARPASRRSRSSSQVTFTVPVSVLSPGVGHERQRWPDPLRKAAVAEATKKQENLEQGTKKIIILQYKIKNLFNVFSYIFIL